MFLHFLPQKTVLISRMRLNFLPLQLSVFQERYRIRLDGIFVCRLYERCFAYYKRIRCYQFFYIRPILLDITILHTRYFRKKHRQHCRISCRIKIRAVFQFLIPKYCNFLIHRPQRHAVCFCILLYAVKSAVPIKACIQFPFRTVGVRIQTDGSILPGKFFQPERFRVIFVKQPLVCKAAFPRQIGTQYQNICRQTGQQPHKRRFRCVPTASQVDKTGKQTFFPAGKQLRLITFQPA